MSMYNYMNFHRQYEFYRQQLMERLPAPFPPSMLPMYSPSQAYHIMPPKPSLPGVDANLENKDLWQQFHEIGSEMVITKMGRRVFPGLRVALSGLNEEASYCVLLEMEPIGDCRFKFSGNQWVPAGGAEPQSPQRIYLHPDSPATGSHWQSQAVNFTKVKVTNNTLDNNGHIVLNSMHQYQPRLHIIQSSDLTQLPWAPQQSFIFPETKFIAVTAYQNEAIIKLKIDNNPFAKAFRETGQSRCKRKRNLYENNADTEANTWSNTNNGSVISITDDELSNSSNLEVPPNKFFRANNENESSLSTRHCNIEAPRHDFGYINTQRYHHHPHDQQQQHLMYLNRQAAIARSLTVPLPLIAQTPAPLVPLTQPVSSIQTSALASPSSSSIAASDTVSLSSSSPSRAETGTPFPSATNVKKLKYNFSIAAILA